MSKQSRKDFMKSIKAPDGYQKFFARVLHWMNSNTMLIWAAVVPVLLIAVGILTWRWYADKQEWKLVDQLGVVQIDFVAEQKVAQEERSKFNDSLMDLEGKILAIESSDATLENPTAKKKLSAAEQEQVKKLNQQKEALEKQIRAIKPDHSKSLGQFVEFFKKHPATQQGWMAAYTAAGIYLDRKETDKARDILKELLQHSSKSDFYQVQAGMSYVNILMDEGQYDEALDRLKNIEAKVDKKLKPLILLTQSKLLLLKGDKAESEKVLDGIQQDFANTPEAEQAKNFRLIVRGS